MTTLNDILEKKSFYMDRMCNQKNEDDEYLFMKYGPFLFKNYPSLESITSDNPRVNYLLDALKIKAVESNGTISAMEMKRQLRGMIRGFESVNKPNPYNKVLVESLLVQIDELRKYQKDNKILESAMISYTPIVPYQAFCTGPGATSEWTKPILEEFHKELRPSKTEELIAKNVKHDLIKDKTKFKTVIEHSFVNNIFSILDSSNIVQESDNEIMLADMMANVYDTKLAEKYPALEYFAMVEYYYNNDAWSDDAVLEAMGNLENFLDCNTTDLIESLSRSNIVEESELPENPVYITDNKVFHHLKEVDTIEKEVGKFNIEKLLSVLHINTAYKCNDFCNNAFLKATGVTNYSFMDMESEPVLVAFVNDSYLCIPIIDQSDDWKLKELCIDADGNVFVNGFLPEDYDSAQV